MANLIYITLDFVKFVDNPTDIMHKRDFENMTCGLIGCALRYCCKHPSEREKVFPHLYLALTGNVFQVAEFQCFVTKINGFLKFR